MSAFKGSVYWKEQCKFCHGYRLCKYRDAVDLLMARLHVVELEMQNCYGSLSFWCDYYQENTEAVKEASKKELVTAPERACDLIEDRDILHCSNCGGGAEKNLWAYWHFCPNCGARVIGGNE